MKAPLLLLLSTVFIGLTASNTWAQACAFTPEGKVAKLLEKAADKRKYDTDQRIGFLQDALEENDDCHPCRHELGVTLFKLAKRGGSFSQPKALLTELVERCPDYHSDPYYYLGAMHYADQEYEAALKHFQAYMEFPDGEPEKFKKDYDKKYDEVREAIPTVKFWKDFYAHGDSFTPERVAGVSSDLNDYLPCLSPDGEIMFYTRLVSRKAKGDFVATQSEEFTWSFRPDINATFDAGEPLPQPFNIGASNYGGATISVDNREMIVAAKNPVADNPQNIDLFVTRYSLTFDARQGKEVYQWSELENLGTNVNTERGWEAQPSLSGDGQTLYFAKVGEGCKADENNDFTHDIFFSERQEDGTWGTAKPLPETINTTGHEKAPYMHSDSKTLYFVSNGHYGRGGLDIFYTRQQPDGSWDTPKNLGHPFNTDGDELGLIVSADGEQAYFVSRNIKGSRMQDVYSIQLPEEAKPEKVMVVKGDVRNAAGQPSERARVKLTYAQSREAEEIEVNADDGSYAAIVNLSRGEDVLMSVEADDMAFNSRVIAKKDEAPPSVVKVKVETETIATGKPFVINDIFYATNSSDINRESQLILQQFAEYLLAHPNLQIQIRGHTDNVGSDRDNLALSMDRAFEVKTLLERAGVPGKRVSAQGFGESKPVASNDSESGRAANRRTEFVIQKM